MAAARSAGGTSRARAGSAPTTAGIAATQANPATTTNQRHDLRTRRTSPNLLYQAGMIGAGRGRGRPPASYG